jgi:hypothetical protein
MTRWQATRRWLFAAGMTANFVSFFLALALDYEVARWGIMRGHTVAWAAFVHWGSYAYLCGFTLSWFGRGWLRIASLAAAPFLIHMWSWRGVIA